MRKRATSFIAKFLAFIMVLQMAVPTTAAYAAEPTDSTLLAEETETSPLEFDSEASYVLATEDGKAAVVSADWGVGTKFTGTYKAASNKVSSDATMFKITSDGVDQTGLAEGEIKVKITCSVEVEGVKQDKDFASEAIGSDATSPFASAGNNDYIITKTGENKGIIESVSNTRTALGLVQEDGKVLKQTTDKQAIPFEDGVEITFVKNPEAVESFGADLGFSVENTYVIATGDKALKPVKGGEVFDWNGRVKAIAAYVSESKEIYDEEAQFKIVPTEDQSGTDEGEQKVTISFVNALDQNGAVCNLRTEDGQTYAWADGRTDNCTYIIKLGEDGKYTIKEASITDGNRKSRYLSVDANSQELNVLNESLTEEAATRFTIVSDYEIGSTGVAFKNKATGKYLRTPGAGADLKLLADGTEAQEGTTYTLAFGTNDVMTVGGQKFNTVSLCSIDFENGIVSVYYDNGAANNYLYTHADKTKLTGNGWEAVRIVPNGDGTVSFKDACNDRYFVPAEEEGYAMKVADYTATDLPEAGKFYLESNLPVFAPTNLVADTKASTNNSLKISWEVPGGQVYTGVEVWQKKNADADFVKVATVGNVNSYTATGLEAATLYDFKVRVVASEGKVSEYSDVVSVKTRLGEKPATPTGVTIEELEGNKVKISWETAKNAAGYEVVRAESMYGEYAVVATANGNETTSVEVAYDENNKYANYYRVVAFNGEGEETERSEQSDFVSLETELFGDHTLIFAPTDDTAKIDETLKALFAETNDLAADAQFKGEHWQIYFKPGDYTETSCINLGFYTAINGLGQTPYDVKLNNVAIPAYLGGENATCNFWRSMENVSIIKTDNEQGNTGNGSWRPEWFNWGVAQAAPLRRVYSERTVAYDWNYGWASGGYVADCYFTGIDKEGNTAGTWSGQQFYTRNSEMAGNVFGTTLNNFFQGVKAPNLPDADDEAAGAATELLSGEGYTNWKIADASGNQQVFTNIEETKKIAEKPFLYIDDNGEYQVFVPAVRENTKGISWSKESMGGGKSVPLSDFYIAYPETDTAATINAKLAEGKHIYFTPGIYYAEETIKVTNANTILLGTGLATIIPDDDVTETIEYAAMEVADVDGVRVAGLIFDAGEHSKYLLVVGEQDSDADHSANPTILQDLFFRVGGTTDVLTKSDDALEINSDDVIGDHFWIWRADHGAGVKWYGNESKHGLIVNGDDVTCYALFNEHFQEYNTLWNGENGATYFYQNETAYDPISQEAWMSPSRLPGGEPQNGYASYKVAEGVKNHYAVGLGVYNVFIYTGPTYDASEVQIQLDNAIEVPDAENVLVENACLQTFADETKVLQKINSVVNGMGDPVSSGTDPVTGETGTSWDRSFLRYYRNGESEGSYRDLQHVYQELIARYNGILAELEKVTDEAERARLLEALEAAKQAIEACGISVTWPIQEETLEQVEDLKEKLENLEEIVEEIEADYREELNTLIESYSCVEKGNNTDEAWDKFQKALDEAKKLAGKAIITAEELQTVKDNLKAAFDMLDVTTKKGLWAEDIEDKVYTGSAIKPEVTVYDGQTLLTKGKDYTVAYSANKNVGEAQIKITGKGNYKGTIIKHFDIVKKDLGSEGITANDVYAVINSRGKVTNPKVTVKYGKTTLKVATATKANDYSVTGYEQALNEDGTAKAGTYTLIITGTGNYKGTTKVTYKVYENKTSVLKMSNAKINFAENSVKTVDYFDTVDGEYAKPTFTVNIGKTELTADDYTITWPATWKVGKNTVTFTAKPGASVPLTGSKTYNVTAVGGSIKDENIQITGIDTEGYAYTGFAIEPEITVSQLDPNSDEGAVAKVLVKDTDYTVTYKNNVNAGNKATVTVKGINGYSGSVTLKFVINKVELTTGIVSLESDKVVYNKKGATPVIIAKLGDYELKAGKDYKVTYANNKAISTDDSKATATITGKGSFTGTLTLEYSVKEATKADVTISKTEMLNPKKASGVKVSVVEAATGKSLKKGTDYTAISYLVPDGEGNYRELTNNDLKDIEQLDVTVKVDLTGVYGTEPEYFSLHIYSKKASTFIVELPQTSYNFTGKNIVPETVTVKVKDGKENNQWKYKELKAGVEYTYTPENYTNNVKVGTYKIAIKGEGIYGGTKTVSYKIAKQDMSWADWYAGIASWFDGLFE